MAANKEPRPGGHGFAHLPVQILQQIEPGQRPHGGGRIKGIARLMGGEHVR